MRKISLAVLIAVSVLAAASCTNSPTSPGAFSATPAKSVSPEPGPGATINLNDLMGTWEATEAEGWRSEEVGNEFLEVAGSRRDLVAEGGAVTLVLEPNSQALGHTIPSGKYMITVTMPGNKPGVDTGFWHFWSGREGPQIDFYPSSLGPDPEYGWIPGFLVALAGNALTLWDSGLTFLPFDFGWGTTPGMTGTSLYLVFSRK